MFGQFLTPEGRVLIEELRGNTRDKGAYMKLSVLVLLDMGKGYDEIEAILGIGRGSISNCRQKYDQDGLDKYLDPQHTGVFTHLFPQSQPHRTIVEVPAQKGDQYPLLSQIHRIPASSIDLL